jgi:signal transduction histidine kinase
MIGDDPSAAERLAEEMQTDIRTTIEDIRRLVYELRPPALDDLGLVAAIQILAAKLGREEAYPQVRVEAPEQLPALPAAVEVAAYRIVQEALTNVIRHAGARGATVRLWLDRDLHVEVADDGAGLNGGGDGGVGLRSMRERAVELGGYCEISRPAAGGTLVRAILPLGAG